MIAGLSNFKVVQFPMKSSPAQIEQVLSQANIPIEMYLIHGYQDGLNVTLIFSFNSTSVLNNMMNLTEQLNNMLGDVTPGDYNQ